jgi:ATP synthase I chain
MTPETENEADLFRTLLICSGFLLLLLVLGGWMVGSRQVASGIACGGLLALGNTLWLKLTVQRAMGLEPRQAGRFAVIRYLLRLAILAGLLYLLLVTIGINIIGLIIGLSVLVLVIES